MPPTVGEKIIKYSGDAGPDQIQFRQIINPVTDEAVTIKKRPLKSFFDENFRIPDYQRRYEWDQENWGELWEEINSVFEINESTVERGVTDIFFGSMFFAKQNGDEIDEKNFDTVYDIIDGQQRTITLTVLFKIMAELLHETMEAEPELFSEFHQESAVLEQLIYHNVGAGTDKRPSLIPNRHQKDLFNALMGDTEDRLNYLYQQDRVHGNTKQHAIRIDDFLSRFGVDPAVYLSNLDDENYYENDVEGRPNLLSSQVEDVRNKDISSVSPDSDFGSELLSNKVRINDDTQRLIEAYTYFKKRLENRLDEFEESKQRCYAIINIKNYVLHSYIVGYFEVSDNQPKLLMKIFEILNDRGMELKKADVMRTRLVARFRSESDRDEYVEKWEQIVNRFGNERIIDFLRTYFVVRGAATSRGDLKDHLLEAFERNPQDDSRRQIESKLEDVGETRVFLDELLRYAEYYDDLTDLENRGVDLCEGGNKAIEKKANQILNRLRNADTSIWEPLVLGVYHDIAEDEIDQQHQLTELLEAVESMAIRKVAGMGTTTRDRAYADAMAEYHANGLEGEFISVLTDIEAEDPNAVGAELVEGLYQNDWNAKWGKQILRKIATEDLEAEEVMVNRELNLRDDIVHLEHIFPQTPIDDESANEYGWIDAFFTGDQAPEGSEGMDISTLVSEFIDNKNQTALLEIAEEYIYDIGNLTLLHQEGNISIQNDLFDRKILIYESTKDYCTLATSGYICDSIIVDYREEIGRHQEIESVLSDLTELEKEDSESNWEDIAAECAEEFESQEQLRDFLDSELTHVDDELEELRTRWTFREVTQNRAHLVRELCQLIAFEEHEFEDVDFEELSERETNRKNDIIAANYRNRLA